MMDNLRDRFLEGRAVLRPALCFDGEHLQPDAALVLRNGRIAWHSGDDGGMESWRPDVLVTPGFFDIQVNGGGGAMLNNDPTPEVARLIARAHRRTGTRWILPTVITDRPEVTEAAANAVIATHGADGIAGIHIEGPHISLARRGTHAAEFVRPLDARTKALVRRLRGLGVPTMLTLAPEAVGPGEIAGLVRDGVVVALGHSDADAAVVRAALDEGAQTFTHLFNAMSQMQGRAPGMVGAAILSEAYASIICDGIHVAPEMLTLAIRARPLANRMIAVTDAMATVAGPDWFELYGKRIDLRDGQLVNSDGALAGAHVTMLESLHFLVVRLGIAAEIALRMVVSNPARLMGLPATVGMTGADPSDLILVSRDWTKAEPLA